MGRPAGPPSPPPTSEGRPRRPLIQPAAISRSAFRAVIRFVASITNVERSEAVCNDERGHTEHDRGERPCADLEAELLRITRAAASITRPRAGFGCTRGGEMAEAALLERRSAPDRGVGTRASNSPAVPANVPIATWPTSSFAGTVRYSSFCCP